MLIFVIKASSIMMRQTNNFVAY